MPKGYKLIDGEVVKNGGRRKNAGKKKKFGNIITKKITILVPAISAGEYKKAINEFIISKFINS